MKLNVYQFSGIYQLESEQIINAPLDKVWEFFSKPQNLNKITPKDMSFEITSQLLNSTYEGQIITYKIEILPKITSNWVTEITTCKEKKFFIDEQRFGPYKMWHHEHHFEELPNGKVLMTDRVSYKLPFGALGKLFAGKIIQKKVAAIFTHRFKVVDDLF